jgi:hypothetical protein
MARGVAGYGRYDDDPDVVSCPWAKSDMTPCLARDGHLAQVPSAKGTVCAGCGNTLAYLYRDLASDYEPARDIPQILDPDSDAARFRNMIYRATSPQDGEGSDDRSG